MELISKAAAIDAIVSTTIFENVEVIRKVVDGTAQLDWLCGVLEAIDAVEDVNTVDAVPVVHGRWVRVHGYATPGGDPVWACSKCGKGRHTYGIEHGSYGADIADGQWVACPNCGAQMDGEQPDES